MSNKSSPSSTEVTFVRRLLTKAPQLPRDISKLLTGAAHRVGLSGPDNLSSGDDLLPDAELRDLALALRHLVRTEGRNMPVIVQERFLKMASRLEQRLQQ